MRKVPRVRRDRGREPRRKKQGERNRFKVAHKEVGIPTEGYGHIQGEKIMAVKVPKTTAKREVKKYHTQTKIPIFPKVFKGKLAVPWIIEKKIIGITIILSI
jgi:hypothetical protein